MGRHWKDFHSGLQREKLTKIDLMIWLIFALWASSLLLGFFFLPPLHQWYPNLETLFICKYWVLTFLQKLKLWAWQLALRADLFQNWTLEYFLPLPKSSTIIAKSEGHLVETELTRNCDGLCPRCGGWVSSVNVLHCLGDYHKEKGKTCRD